MTQAVIACLFECNERGHQAILSQCDFDATNDKGENHVTSVFLRDGDDIYRTYFTDRRGVEHLGSHWTYLDLTPFGRQESWEDSPEGWPKSDDFATRRHNEYAD